MRKLTVLLLVSAMLISTLASCGDSGTPENSVQSIDTTAPAPSESEEVTISQTDNLPITDMEGYKLNMLNFDEDSWLTWANTRITVDEMDGDITNDALFTRESTLEERFNFELNVVETATNPINDLKKNVAAGDNTYEIYFYSEGGTLDSLPYISDWNNIPYLQLDSQWWNPNATKVYNISGRQVALAGNISLSAVSRSVCMVFNKNIYAQYIGTDETLYDIVAENKWTVDKYLSVVNGVSADLNGDGVYDVNDLYGLNMGRGFKGYIASFLCGSGMNFTEADSDGNQVFTLISNERGISLMQKLVNMLSIEGYYYNEDKTVHGFQPENFFSSGHALFTQGVPHDIYKLRDMDDDIGIVPIPKYDESQEDYYAAAWGGEVMVLSRTYDTANAENIGIILEAMSFIGYYDIIPQYKEVALKTKTARDNESEAMLDIIFDSIYFDFGTNIMYDAVIANSFLTDIYVKKSSDVIVSSMEKAMPKIDKYISDILVLVSEME